MASISGMRAFGLQRIDRPSVDYIQSITFSRLHSVDYIQSNVLKNQCDSSPKPQILNDSERFEVKSKHDIAQKSGFLQGQRASLCCFATLS